MTPETLAAPRPTATPVTPSAPAPFARIMQMLTAYELTAALKAGIELGLFTAIAEGSSTVPQLAAKLQTQERGTRMLCDFLTVSGILTKSGDRYELPPDVAAFLDRRSPSYMGGMTHFLCHPIQSENMNALAQIVRTGQVPRSHISMDQHAWVEFAESMIPVAMPPAKRIAELLGGPAAGPIRVLDVPSSHGQYGIAIARSNPQAQITAMDLPEVVGIGEKNAVAAGLAGRYRTIAGDFFQVELGSGYDVALLTNFLHHFDRPTCVSILRKLRAAVKPGGKLVTVDWMPEDDRVSPPQAGGFVLKMLAGTPTGDVYTLREHAEMAAEAGFLSATPHQVAPGFPMSILICS